LTVLLSLIEKV